jgi:hypothetical protein
MPEPISGRREAVQAFNQDHARAAREARHQEREVRNVERRPSNRVPPPEKAEPRRSVALRRATENGFSNPSRPPTQRGGVPQAQGNNFDVFA